MKTRHQARELALQVLFQTQFPSDFDARTTLMHYRGPSMEEVTFEYAKDLVLGVITTKSELDKRLQALVKNWTLDRLAAVDLAVLRIAAYEMSYLELGPKIAINEAIELSKKFGTTESGSFVNGVLDEYARHHLHLCSEK
jgi:N utilization substance protein B